MKTSSPIALRPTYHRGRWFTPSCAFTGDPFGGLFTKAEAAYLLRVTSGLDYALSPAEFGQFASAAVRWCKDNPLISTLEIPYDLAA